MNVFVIGEPAVGKSTIVKKVLSTFKEIPQAFKFKKVTGRIYHGAKVVLLGDYGILGTALFGGTDKFSMAVQSDAIEFLSLFPEKFEGFSLLLEGDRLNNPAFIEKFLLSPSRVVLVEASPEEKKTRHEKRGDKQSKVWLQGRETKVQNIRKAFPVEVVRNETEEDLSRNAELILSLLKN